MFAERIKNLNSSFIRDILAVTQQPDIISFAGGLPAPDVFPVEEFSAAHSLEVFPNPSNGAFNLVFREPVKSAGSETGTPPIGKESFRWNSQPN